MMSTPLEYLYMPVMLPLFDLREWENLGKKRSIVTPININPVAEGVAQNNS